MENLRERLIGSDILPPQSVLKIAFDRHQRPALSFSGAEDVILIDMALKMGGNVAVFCLDTGRLHPETYRYIELVRKHYGITIDMVLPEAEPVRKLVASKGLFSFYEDGHKECCSIRKIIPLKKHLRDFDGWITGQRKDQSITRVDVPQEQIDPAFSSESKELMKYNPLSDWSSVDVWNYIRNNAVPYNPLHDRGFVSIGCEPCTRPTGPGQHEREGRWWWEQAAEKECGLHVVDSKK